MVTAEEDALLDWQWIPAICRQMLPEASAWLQRSAHERVLFSDAL